MSYSTYDRGLGGLRVLIVLFIFGAPALTLWYFMSSLTPKHANQDHQTVMDGRQRGQGQ